MRIGLVAQAEMAQLLEEGHSQAEEMVRRLGLWEPMDFRTRDFQRVALTNIVKRIALVWPVSRAGDHAKPKILFRTSKSLFFPHASKFSADSSRETTRNFARAPRERFGRV